MCSFQEIISLNAGNIFGVEDGRPIPKWERIIRETLNKIQPVKTKGKCYSHPPSPSKFEQSSDFTHIEDEVLLGSESDEEEEEIYSSKNVSDSIETSKETSTGKEVLPDAGENLGMLLDEQLSRHFYTPKTLDGGNAEAFVPLQSKRMKKRLSKKELVGLSWAEPPLDLLAHCNIDRTTSLTSQSFKTSKSFNTFNFLKSSMKDDGRVQSDTASISKIDLELLVNWKRRSHYVRIVSKQMVGLFVTIWVRRSLRRHIQNVNVSTVGVGAMGYMGNKVCSLLSTSF